MHNLTHMKIAELFESQTNDLATHEEVIAWCKAKIKSKKLIFGYSERPDVAETAPFKINANRVIFQKTAILKKPLPVQFSEATSYELNECKYLTDLGQLRVDKVGRLKAEKTDLQSLHNCPEITHSLDISYTPIKSLEGISTNLQELRAYSCQNLIAIDTHMPKLKRLIVSCSGLTSLKNIHKFAPNLESLQINMNPIESNILGLLRLPKLRFFIYSPGADGADRLKQALQIVEKHFKGDKNIIACQEELFKNGLDEYAKL